MVVSTGVATSSVALVVVAITGVALEAMAVTDVEFVVVNTILLLCCVVL